MKPGQRVRSMVLFSGVHRGTEGYIIEDYGTGVTVAWDLPDRPYPDYMIPEEIACLPDEDPRCPLRDEFDKKTELQYLEVCKQDQCRRGKKGG